jgi:heat shock protein HslJ
MHRRESLIILGRVAAASAAALVLAACSPSPAAVEGEPSAAGGRGDPERPSLYGRWRIVEVNGGPARSVRVEPGSEPAVGFGPGGYGGTTGCNSFGGHGLLVGDRWFADSGVQTEMACGDLTDQETAIMGVLSGGPTIAFGGEDSVTLTAPRGALRLRRLGPPTPVEPAEPPMLLAGTRWTLYTADGGGLPPGPDRTPHLTFEADRWALQTGCGARSGAWTQAEGEVRLEADGAAPPDCTPNWPRPTRGSCASSPPAPCATSWDPTARSCSPEPSTGPPGQREIAFGGEEARSLWGQWRVRAVDGAAPPASERAPEVILGPGAYAVWDGCAHREGVALIHARQLFTLGSGMVTSANCPEDPVRRRINAVVAATPRIARTADGDLALVSRSGALRLQRTSTRPFGTGVVMTLGGGMVFDILPAGPARLALGPGQAFTLTLPCGRLEGRWRNERSRAGTYARFSPEPLPAACADDPAARRLEQFLTGDVSVAIGPNKDIALFINGRESLAARVVS